MDEWPLPRRYDDDPHNLLSKEARLRIRESIRKAHVVREATLEALNSEGIETYSPRWNKRWMKSLVKAARLVMQSTHTEFSRIPLTRNDFCQIMQDEIESISNSYELPDNGFARSLLLTEFGTPHYGQSLIVAERESTLCANRRLSQPRVGSIRMPCDRKKRVEHFLERCNGLSATRILKGHLWRAIGHSQAREFMYWQACDDKVAKAAAVNFERILAMEPRDFIALLKRKGLLTKPKA